MLQVTIHHPDGAAERVSFSKPEVLIGRRADSDIVLASPDVSSAHACLRRDETGVCLVDLASTNGSFVNGRRTDLSAPLVPADEIRIAGFRLQICEMERAAAVLSATDPAARSREIGAPPPVVERTMAPPSSTWDTDLPPLVGQDLAEAPPLVALKGALDLPPLVVQRRPASGESAAAPKAPPPPARGSSLAQIWRAGDVQALLIAPDSLRIVTQEGASRRLPPPGSEEVAALLDELAPELAGSRGRAAPPVWIERELEDGSVLRCAGVPGCLSLRRPPPARLSSLSPEDLALVRAGLRRRAVLVVAAPSDVRAALLQEIGSATLEPGALIRLDLEPVPPAPSVLHLEPPAHAAAAAVRMAHDLERVWVAIDRADDAALIALAGLRGVAILIGVDDPEPHRAAAALDALRPEIIVSAPVGSTALRVRGVV